MADVTVQDLRNQLAAVQNEYNAAVDHLNELKGKYNSTLSSSTDLVRGWMKGIETGQLTYAQIASGSVTYIVNHQNEWITFLTAYTNWQLIKQQQVKVDSLKVQIDNLTSQINSVSIQTVQENISNAVSAVSNAVSNNLPLVLGFVLGGIALIAGIIYWFKRKKKEKQI